MATHQHDNAIDHNVDEPHAQDMTKGKIWRVFFYLLFLTGLEFFIALALVHPGHIEKGLAVNTVYILLTLVKAYYIVAYFMHLKFEKRVFIGVITLSMFFIVYFIVLMLIEGAYLKFHYNEYPWWPNP